MSETIKTGDFVELDYTGILKEGNLVFDTTIAETAKKEGLFDPKITYGPVAMCVGQGQILKGLDGALEGAEVGVEKDLELGPEQAFGKKDGKLLKLVQTSIFKKEGIKPMVGLQVNIDGQAGTIRNVSGGRTVVDFNHPFAGKDVIYKVKVMRKITDPSEKVKSLLHLTLNQKMDAIKVDVNNAKCKVTLKKEFPNELLDFLKNRVTEVMEEIKEVEFAIEGKEAEAPKKEAKPVKEEKQETEQKKPDKAQEEQQTLG